MRVGPATFGVMLLVASCGPNLSDIHVSECMSACNIVNKACLDDANARGDTKAAETCLTTCLDCIDDCAAQLERTLK